MTKVLSESVAIMPSDTPPGSCSSVLPAIYTSPSLTGGVEIGAGVRVQPLQDAVAFGLVPAQRRAHRRRLKALEIRGRAGVCRLADPRLEAEKLVAPAAQRGVDVDPCRDVEHGGVGARAGDDHGARKVDAHVGGSRAQRGGECVAAGDRPGRSCARARDRDRKRQKREMKPHPDLPAQSSRGVSNLRKRRR